METDELYKQQMGQRYDPDLRHRQIENGVSGYTPIELEEPDNDGLYIKSASDSVASRIGSIETDIAFLKSGELTPEEIDDIVLMEAERVVLYEQLRLDQMAQEHPKFATAIHDYLFTELESLVERGEPVDDEMFVEARILADLIVEANGDGEDPQYVELARLMKSVIDVRHECAMLAEVVHLQPPAIIAAPIIDSSERPLIAA